MISSAVEFALPKGWMPQKSSDFLVNPTGNFVVGGPDGDLRPHRPQDHRRHLWRLCAARRWRFFRQGPRPRCDRSAAYAARYSREERGSGRISPIGCTIQVAYAIGVADPMSVLVDTHGTGKVDEKKLEKVLPEIFRLTPTNIRRSLKLNRPIYRADRGVRHFGRAPEKDGGFSWSESTSQIR